MHSLLVNQIETCQYLEMETRLEQRLQEISSQSASPRTAPAAAPAPGTAATKTVLNKPGARPDLKYTPSPMDTKVREIENAIGSVCA